jgi:hypothetical protein
VIDRLWPHLVPEGAAEPVTTQELRKQQEQDSFCTQYLACLRAEAGVVGAAAEWASIGSVIGARAARRVARECGNGLFAVREGLLCRLSDTIGFFDHLAMPVLPPALRPPVLAALHDTTLHPGRDRTLAVVSARYWWPRMALDVAEFVN